MRRTIVPFMAAVLPPVSRRLQPPVAALLLLAFLRLLQAAEHPGPTAVRGALAPAPAHNTPERS